ncbi:NADPH-dependent aldehyde reductase-like protein [Drosera capensis]
MSTEAPAAAAAAGTLPLLDRVAIVTGSSRGIGRAIALHLASLGARLVINYTSNPTHANSLVSLIDDSTTHSLPVPTTSSYPRAVAIQADVSDPAQVTALFDAAQSTFNSQAHILVTCAGVLDGSYPTIAATSVADFDRIFAVNARGTFLCLQAAANRLVRGGGGRIITVSSSLVGSLKPGYGAYVASKAAVEAMTRILAKELRGTRITANGIAPGPIATEMFFQGKTEETVKAMAAESPMERIGETRDVASVVAFLAGDESEWVNGQIIRVNGGYV